MLLNLPRLVRPGFDKAAVIGSFKGRFRWRGAGPLIGQRERLPNRFSGSLIERMSSRLALPLVNLRASG